jgi:hypothetical protein
MLLPNKRFIALRMDDPGASSKRYEVYSKFPFNIGNFLFLKYIHPFKAWGPYCELNVQDWENILYLLTEYNAKLTVAITSSWVNWDGSLTPFNVKFPDVVPVIKKGINSGVIKIASHGLTHCVVHDKLFRPKLFSGNRNAHREFWDYIDYPTQLNHLTKSKLILENIFDVDVNMIVPPGNVFSEKTLLAAVQANYTFLNCNGAKQVENTKLRILDNSDIVAFHDREIKLFGVKWLENLLLENRGCEFKFVEELF